MRGVLLVPLALGSLCEEPPAQPIEIPAQVQGTFGRDASDLEFGTLGLEIGSDAIRFSEMTITVTDGKMVGDTFQIGRAEVRWKKDGDKLPKECKGTLARQGPRLLLSLFKKDADEACESVLEGDWTEWTTITELPETMRGLYGATDPYAPADPIVVGATEVTTPYGEAPIVLKSALRFVDRDSEIIVREATMGEQVCKGALKLEDDTLLGPLEDCATLRGRRWTVRESAVPKGTLSNGRVTVAFAKDEITVRSDAGSTCTHAILRTAQRPTTDAGRDRIPVPSGEVLVLAHGALEGAQACTQRLKNLYQAQCQQMYGAPCTDEELPTMEAHCPTHLVVGDLDTKGRKMALLPDDVSTVACFDMTGDFVEK